MWSCALCVSLYATGMVMLGVGKARRISGLGVAWDLFRDEFPFFVEGTYIVLFVWR